MYVSDQNNIYIYKCVCVLGYDEITLSNCHLHKLYYVANQMEFGLKTSENNNNLIKKLWLVKIYSNFYFASYFKLKLESKLLGIFPLFFV